MKTTNGPVGIPTGDTKVGVVEPAKGPEEPEVRILRPIWEKEREDGQVLTVCTRRISCRWCAKEYEVGCFDKDRTCTNCGAYNMATLNFRQDPHGRSVNLWYNPDNSLFFEFSEPGGKTARITLSPETMKALGILELFDQPPNGKKTA